MLRVIEMPEDAQAVAAAKVRFPVFLLCQCDECIRIWRRGCICLIMALRYKSDLFLVL